MTVEIPYVHVFFYGTFLHPDVLMEHGVTPGEVIPAKVSGYELTIRPRVNLTRSDHSCVFGSVVTVTHADLANIYSYLEEHFGLKYLPEAVLAETLNGRFIPALCYIAPEMTTGPADPDYVIQLAEC